ncbi:hypothetical protein BJ912DRAFT_325675 [Pholiota molesta]|nr:hypothetical protein BJ912DRAFT_325675 [Pholiota molesta]
MFRKRKRSDSWRRHRLRTRKRQEVEMDSTLGYLHPSHIASTDCSSLLHTHTGLCSRCLQSLVSSRPATILRQPSTSKGRTNVQYLSLFDGSQLCLEVVLNALGSSEFETSAAHLPLLRLIAGFAHYHLFLVFLLLRLYHHRACSSPAYCLSLSQL